MFKVKICGITNVNDALTAADAGADAIGLNFYRGSSRCVAVEEANRISEALTHKVDRVGVFVNAGADEIKEVCRAANIHLVQLHGDESPQFLGELNRDFDIIRVRRLDERGMTAVGDDIAACCDASGFGPDAILIDADAGGAFGGTGKTVDWQLLVRHNEWWREYPLILAGGLTPENVDKAIRIVRPNAVDVASGVESTPGKKDAIKVRDFVAAAREAFEQIGS